ncbi:MAG: hypothetical protein QW472_03945, partial [Candidatus Aenigmatarchaeota archaeon]
MFEAEDSRLYTANTSAKNFTIEKDDVMIQLVEGNYGIVWRNGTQTISLKVNLTDIDQNIPAVSANVTFWITTDGSTWDSGTITLTDENGIAEYPFDPNCDYSTGIQKWKAGSTPNFYYKYANTSNFTLTIKSFIALNISYPDGNAFLVGTKVPFIGQAYDDCSGIPGASVTFSDNFGASWYECAPVSDQGNGTYNCTFDTTGRPFGWHNIRMRANKQYYGDYPTPNETIKTNAYFVASQPVLSNPSLDHVIGGWGELYTFSVLLTDTDKNYNNVSLWKSFDQSNWTLVDSKFVQPTYSNYPVSFQVRFSCEDYLNATNGTNYWKINTTDIYGYSDETQIFNFTLDVDNVTVSIGSDSSSSVRRIGDNLAYFRFIIYDTDRGVYVNDANGTFWITRNGISYDYNLTCVSHLGNCSVSYNPDCSSSVGIQYWKAGTTDACYQKLNTSNSSFIVYGQLNISLVQPTYGKIINRDKNTSLNASVTNDCNQEITDASVRWYNSTWNLIASGYNTTWRVPATYKLGPETIYSNVTREYYDPNSNSTLVYVYGWSDVSYIEPINSSVYSAGSVVNIKCGVIDGNTSLPLSNYLVYFYKNGNNFANVSTSYDGNATVEWNTIGESAGWYNITCVIKDNSTQYYNASISQRETWIRITRPLLIDRIVRQYTSIYRNDSFSPHKTNISVHVKDANIGDANNANVTFYNSSTLLASCLTNSTGWCDLMDFNPEDTIAPQAYVIYINATRAGNENSETNTTTIIVKGILNTTIISPLNNSYYSKSQSIPLRANGTSENGESFLILNPTIKWYNETAQIAEGNDTSLPQSRVAEQSTGPHQFMAVAIKPYFDDGRANVTVIITGLADVVWISPTGIVPYPQSFEPTCLVKDHESQAGIANYVVNFSYKWEPSTEFIFNGSYVTNSSGYASYAFTPTQKGNITFNCTIGDNETQYYSANIKEALEMLWVKDVTPPQIYDVSILPNASLEANLNSTNITATIWDNYRINSVWANITLPNQSFVVVPMSNITVPEIGFGYYNATYRASYLPPIGGIYSVRIYARDEAPEYNTNYTFAGYFEVFGKSYPSLQQCVNNTEDGNLTDCDDEIEAPFITQTQGFSFEVKVNFTNLGPATIYSVNLTHEDSGYMTYNESEKKCGTLYVNQSCIWAFLVNVLPATPPQTLETRVNATWRNPDLTINSTFGITYVNVHSNPVLNIIQEKLENVTPHDEYSFVGILNVSSDGNDEVLNVRLDTFGLSNLPQGHKSFATDCGFGNNSCEITLVPTQLGSMPAGTELPVSVYVNIPFGTSPGLYLLNIRAQGQAPLGGTLTDLSLLNVSVPLNTSWTRTPETFGTILAPLNTQGIIGYINVSNIGNVKIGFSQSEQDCGSEIGGMLGGTLIVSEDPSSGFDVDRTSYRLINVTYNVPAGQPVGLYCVRIVIKNSTATPTQQLVNMILNVTDVPPTISDVLIHPTLFEVGFETVRIQAKITDNFDVDKAWINVTQPDDSIVIQFMNSFGSTYNTTYSSSKSGIHKVKICANDTQGLMACTQEYEIEGSETTYLEILPNIMKIIANNITIYSGQSFQINITLNNTGGSRAMDVNLTIATSENVSSEPSLLYYGLMLKHSSKSNTTIISVAANTTPGFYHANLTANWTNLNGTLGTNNSTLEINVTENQFVHALEEKLVMFVESGSSGTNDFTIKSAGNVNASNITFVCYSGEVCTNFTVSFNPENISSLGIGETASINITITVPPNYPSGTHLGTVRINYDEEYAEIPVEVKVPMNISWEQMPVELKKKVFGNESGFFGTITVINTGNIPILLNMSVNGTIADKLLLNATQFTLGYGEVKAIGINYASPDVIQDSNFTGYITSKIIGDLAENASVKERSSYAELYVYSYKVSIVTPNKTNPILNVNPGDILLTRVNVTSNSTPVTTGLSFNVLIYNSSIYLPAIVYSTQFNSSDSLWYVRFYAPNLSLARIYSLNVTANYTLFEGRVRSALSEDSVVYNDAISPSISIWTPIRVATNASVPIKVNVTEAGGLKNVSFKMKYPDSSVEEIDLQFTGKINDVYTYATNFTNTSSFGIYNFSARACDLSGNCGEAFKTFEIYPVVFFVGYSKDVESQREPPLLVNFLFYDANTSDLRFNFTSNASTGYYNETIDVKSYDLTISTVEEGFKNYV